MTMAMGRSDLLGEAQFRKLWELDLFWTSLKVDLVSPFWPPAPSKVSQTVWPGKLILSKKKTENTENDGQFFV